MLWVMVVERTGGVVGAVSVAGQPLQTPPLRVFAALDSAAAAVIAVKCQSPRQLDTHLYLNVWFGYVF